MATAKPLTVMFWPESAYGPTNQCIGLAAILRDRGHRIVFAAESSWAGKLAPLGFVEELVDLAEPADGPADEDPGKFWTDFITETAPEFRKPTVEQLQTFIQPTYQALIDGAKYCQPRLSAIVAEHLPQTTIIPQVDLVISHGGNNTVTETLHFGKPLIVLPLFWDQYENAQRIDELGFGVRLNTYGFADDELTGAVDTLLADTALRARLADIGTAIRARDGLRIGADVIERVGRQHSR